MSRDAIAEAKKKLLEIDETIKKLDPAIRAAAFDQLAAVYFGPNSHKPTSGGVSSRQKSGSSAPHTGKDEFFAAFDHDQPKDNVLLIVAWLYSQYGKYPITRADIEREANEAGLTVPDRSDNTMRQAKKSGKTLFRQQGKGWELTMAGEARIKEVYGVKRGNQSKANSRTSHEE